MSSGERNSKSERRPKGIVTGRAIMIATGCVQLSNCAAMMRYMNRNDSPKATRK